MNDKYDAVARSLAKYFDWDKNSEQTKEVAKELRKAAADGIEEGAAIGGTCPTLTARRRVAALRRKSK